MIRDHRAQSAVWGLLALLVLIALAAGLVDLYRLYAARNWGYALAQEAALMGASIGRDFSAVTAGEPVGLDEGIASGQAQQIVQAAMADRGLTDYQLDVRVLPDPAGGSIPGFPPRPVRLGPSLGEWHSDEPAVGVYLSFPVKWLLLGQIGVVEKSVSVFAAAGVGQ